MVEKVLFVDDDASVLQLIQAMLRDQFNVDVAEDSREALRLLSTNGPYAVIVTDVHMPGPNGIKLMSWTKGIWPDTVRLVLTGDAGYPAVTDDVDKNNVYRILYKPFDSETLKNVLADAVGEHKRLVSADDLPQ